MPKYLAILLLIVLAVHTPRAWSQESVAITEFVSESNGNDAYCEWVELYNFGTAPVTLTNWTISDEDTDSAAIPSATIPAKGFVILARSKPQFEAEWLAGIPNAAVLDISTGMAMGASGDELILKNGSGTVVWKIAYRDDETLGRATFLTGDSFAARTYGSKASPGVYRNGNDVTGALGYQGNDHTSDTLAFVSASSDWGSPLLGHYSGAVTPSTTRSINASVTGQAINPGVRGLAIADVAINRSSYYLGIPDTLAVVDGSALRGVAGGLYADLYDWKVRNNEPRPPTLEFLRYARNHNANLFITVNTRGLVVPNPLTPGRVDYYTSDTTTLARLAGDWVRYTNRIAQTYRQGQTITDLQDAAIMTSLTWSSTFPGDTFDTLLAQSETSVPKVRYWEIGNEPTVSTSGSIGVNNGYILDETAFYNRYKAITAAMLAEDSTIKVGPCIVNGTGSRERDHLNSLFSDPACRVDFVSYHPYQRMGDVNTAPEIEAYLGCVYENQYTAAKTIRDIATSNGRSLASLEMVASEVNVSNWPSNETVKECEMAHALGSVETVFTHARLGLSAAHYWIWPANQFDSWRYPIYKAYEKLRDYMGDTMLDVYSDNNLLRIYTMRDSRTGRIAVWGLNFSNSVDRTMQLSFAGLPPVKSVRLLALGDTTRKTTFFSSNLATYMTGGPTVDVEWQETPLSNPNLTALPVTFAAAEITLLLIESEVITAADTVCMGYD